MGKLLGINRSLSNEIVKVLAPRESGVVGPFVTIRELLCFAAMLGFQKKRRVPLPDGPKEDIAFSTFDENDAYNYVFLIGVAETKSLEILKDGRENELQKIFEEYAQGGLDIIASWMTKYSDPKGFNAIVRGLHDEGYIDSETVDPKLIESVRF